MAKYPPFMNSTGTIPKILNKIKQAQTPERFTQDYLAETLIFPGGSAKSFLPLAKRLGLLASDGTPTELYKSFRNPKTSEATMAQAIREGYSDFYSRNEFAHELDQKGLDGLIMEATGLERGHTTIYAIRGTFEALKGFADFKSKVITDGVKTPSKPATDAVKIGSVQPSDDLPLNLTYSIHLVLPNTDDVAVFNAIFRSLKENLFSQ